MNSWRKCDATGPKSFKCVSVRLKFFRGQGYGSTRRGFFHARIVLPEKAAELFQPLEGLGPGPCTVFALFHLLFHII
jgi:hypothetical protein